jgi:hypothetical protein
MVWDDGIRLPLPLPGRFQVFQGLFEQGQVRSHPHQLLLGGFRLSFDLREHGTSVGQGLLHRTYLRAQLPLLLMQLLAGQVFCPESGGGGRQLLHHLTALFLQIRLIADQSSMQFLAAALVLGEASLVLPLPRSPMLGSFVGLALRHFRCLLLGLRQCRALGPAIHDEQDEDQRPHRAEQHRQEGEGRDVQTLATASHAALPVVPRGGPNGSTPSGPTTPARAVSR